MSQLRSTPQPRALVIGAGIGGLTASAALHLRGWQVTVLERAAELRPIGAGIGIAANGQRALDVIGLGDAVRALRSWHTVGGLRTSTGRWLSRTSNEAAAERFGGPVVLVHRAQLVELLRSVLPTDAVRTGSAAELVDAGGPDRPARVRGADGEELEAELVVAADGIHSATRTALFPKHPAPRYSGFTSWRIVVPAPAGEPFPPHETWGRGAVWGSQPLADGRVYAYGAARAPVGERAADSEQAELRRRFGTWHDPIPALIDSTSEVLRNDVFEMARPLPAMHRGRTALLGDAVHPMTPNLGQGGNQAIEDAIVLAHHADPAADLPDLDGYTAARLDRTTMVAGRSHSIGRAALMASAPGAVLRNAAATLANRIGPKLALRSLDGIADWRPPQTAPYRKASEPAAS